MIKLRILLFPLIVLIALYSCRTREQLVYFQSPASSQDILHKNYTPIIRTDDFLAISITCDDLEAATPFNNISNTSPNLNNGYTMGNAATVGYLVDEKGEVKLPVIGVLKIADLTRMQASVLIEEKLKPYLRNPIVNIQIQNFKITVLGDVKSPGTFKIPNERITLLEAIGLAGDLKNTGIRQNVLVIRDVNGKKEEYRIDLTKKDIFNSPVYYLNQNDLVYVEPNRTARYESTLLGKTAPIFISVTSLIIATINIILR
jgi:polysaccharide export outer membrane protein